MSVDSVFNGYLGCDHHYSPLGHAVLKDAILEQVREALGWDPIPVKANTSLIGAYLTSVVFMATFSSVFMCVISWTVVTTIRRRPYLVRPLVTSESESPPNQPNAHVESKPGTELNSCFKAANASRLVVPLESS